jgi:exodeoxyribonuclease VII small subunit
MLVQKVKRAADLIKILQEKLRATETEADNMIKQMEGAQK